MSTNTTARPSARPSARTWPALRRAALYTLIALMISLFIPCIAPAAEEAMLERAELQQFLDEMVEKHGFDRTQLRTWFAGVKARPDIIEAITHPAEAKPWHEYRKIFLTQARIQGGLEYWEQHAELLASAEREYGVPAQIIVAIIGVESRYGRYRGRHAVLESLTTLGLDYPKRSAFFISELEQFLLLAREQDFDPTQIRGSYAGAMGAPQFISSSYRNYAVDFDGDKKMDLFDSQADIIGSVANYFHRHGWQAGEPVTQAAKLRRDTDPTDLPGGFKPKQSVADLTKLGVRPLGYAHDSWRTALLALEQEDDTDYWLVYDNFYVITRYNHSPLYAMAVYQLSEAIAQLRRAQTQESDL